MPQRTKNDKKTSVINQKQHFQSSMGCYNSIGICCSMVLDTKLSKDFKFSIKNRKLSVSDPHIGQNMTKNASKWPATYPWEWGQGFANLTKSDLNTSSPRVKTNDSALESWWYKELSFRHVYTHGYQGAPEGERGGWRHSRVWAGQHTRFWWFQIPVAFGSQIETSDSARKQKVRRAPLGPILTQLGLERLKRWGGRGWRHSRVWAGQAH